MQYIEFMPELKTLEFKTVDLDAPPAENVKVPLGGHVYVAHCPNDYEFTELNKAMKKMFSSGGDLDVLPVLKGFFDPIEREQILDGLEGSQPRIRLVEDLWPALSALADHYEPIVTERMKAIQKALSAPK